MKVRKAKINDAKGIVEVHYDAVHNTASADYPANVLNAWHGGVTEPRIEKIRKVIQGSDEEIFVCEHDGKIIGFSSIVPEFNELRAVYVCHEHGKKGVGAKLLNCLEDRANELNLKKLQLHSSITAKSFYRKHGFIEHSEGVHTLNNGTKMACVLMSKRYDVAPSVELVTCINKKECIDFLEHGKETCLFLLGNLSDYGYQLNEHLNSGNYRIIRRHLKVVGVFSITRRGNVLIQTDGLDDYSPEVLSAVKADGLPIKGIFGPWRDCWLFKSYYETSCDKFKTHFVSKEELYSRPLKVPFETIELKQGQEIRYLQKKDFADWDRLNRAYLEEEGLSIQGSDEQRRSNFLEKTKDNYWWGLFVDKKLVSIGAHNTRYKNLGQIGGVFTSAHERRKGYSKLCMKKLIHDSREDLHLETLILFTGYKNIAAQNLYKSLGFKKIGYFGLIFGNEDF